jgi:hypothetical protein
MEIVKVWLEEFGWDRWVSMEGFWRRRRWRGMSLGRRLWRGGAGGRGRRLKQVWTEVDILFVEFIFPVAGVLTPDQHASWVFLFSDVKQISKVPQKKSVEFTCSLLRGILLNSSILSRA